MVLHKAFAANFDIFGNQGLNASEYRNVIEKQFAVGTNS